MADTSLETPARIQGALSRVKENATREHVIIKPRRSSSCPNLADLKTSSADNLFKAHVKKGLAISADNLGNLSGAEAGEEIILEKPEHVSARRAEEEQTNTAGQDRAATPPDQNASCWRSCFGR